MFDDALKKLAVAGTIGVIPTDTVYGVVARAADQSAVERLYKLKQREHKPGTIIAANIGQLVELGIKRRYLKAVEQFWPGAVSVIVPASDPKLQYLHQGKLSLAIRIPDYLELTGLLNQTGPLLTTSVNLPGEPPAQSLEEAKRYFGDDIDFYVDVGNMSGHQPSTIIRIVDDAIEVLREGAVKIDPNN